MTAAHESRGAQKANLDIVCDQFIEFMTSNKYKQSLC